MKKLEINKYNDFINVVKELNSANIVLLDLSDLKSNLRIRILDLIAGYIYNKGNIKKVDKNSFIVSIYNVA